MSAVARPVVAPDGRTWRLRRRWLPHRRVRWRRMRLGHRHDPAVRQRWYTEILNYLDIPDFGDLGDLGTLILVVLGLVLVGIVSWLLVVPALLAVIDAVVIVAVALAGVVAHLVLRRPWEIEAVCGDENRTWLVPGWRSSRRCMAEVEAGLASGTPVSRIQGYTRPRV